MIRFILIHTVISVQYDLQEQQTGKKRPIRKETHSLLRDAKRSP